MVEKKNVKINIMQREFTIACIEGEEERLLEAATYLDRQMRSVAESGQVLGIDRRAILAGLNISNSLLVLQKTVEEHEAVDARLRRLHDRIDKFFSNHPV